jgi:hypothetical protein
MHAASLPLRVGVRRLDERGACVFETMPGAGRAAGTPLRVQLALGPKGLLSARAAGGGAAVALSELWMAMCDEAPPAADGDEEGAPAPPSVASLSSLSVSVSQPARRGVARGGATPRSSAVNSSTSAAAGGYAPSVSSASYSSLHSKRSRGAPAVRVQKVRLEKMLEAPAEGEGDADVPVVTLAL